MNIAWSLHPKYWRLGRYQTFTKHPTTGADIIQNNWWCFGPIAISFDENDPWS